MAEEKQKTEEKEEKKHEEKTEKKDVAVQAEKKEKKITETKVKGLNLPISLRHSIAICKFIKGKKIDEAIKMLEDVAKLRIAVPMRGEIPHRKNIGSGRYPVKASHEIINLLKSLSANASVKNLNVAELKVYAKADTGTHIPRGGRIRRGFKRTNIILIGK